MSTKMTWGGGTVTNQMIFYNGHTHLLNFKLKEKAHLDFGAYYK